MVGEIPGRRGTARESEVDRKTVQAEGEPPLLGCNEIADQRARRRPVQLGGRAREERARQGREVAARLREREHCHARREHRQRDRVSAV